MKSILKHNKKVLHQAGFTLIEMLVAVSIFAIVMVVSVGTLIVLVSSANSAQVLQSISTNLSFALDNMTRNIRTGYSYYCTNSSLSGNLPLGTNGCASGGRAIVFTESSTNTRIAYRYNSTEGSLEQRVSSTGSWRRLTSDDVKIEKAVFYVNGSAEPSGEEQPTVRVILTASAADGGVTETPFYLQTTIVQRILD